MADINDGGPAFPGDERNDNGTHRQSHNGMSLRDYFAAKALSTFLAHYSLKRVTLQEQADVAKFAYSMADAMLKARSV